MRLKFIPNEMAASATVGYSVKSRSADRWNEAAGLALPVTVVFILCLSLPQIGGFAACAGEEAGKLAPAPSQPLPAGYEEKKPPMVSAIRSLDQAKNAFERQDYVSAMEAVAAGLAASPFYPPLWLMKGKAEMALKNYAAAREAFGVCVLANPDNAEARVLALNAVLESDDLDKKQKQNLLGQRIGAVSPSLFEAMLQGAILDAPDLALKLETFMPIWNESGVGPDLARKFCEHYRQQEFSEAAKLLASAEAESLSRPLGGRLHFIIGRVLPWVDQDDAALSHLARARELGFEEAEAGRLMGMIHRSNNRPGRAAEVWEEVWRGTDNPANVAQDAAEAYRRDNRPEKALELIDRACLAFPNHAGLQAEKWLSLRLSGDADRLRSYEAELAAKPAGRAGLGYARACLAWEREDYKTYYAEEAAVKKYLDSRVGSYLTSTNLDTWVRFGDWLHSNGDLSDYRHLGALADDLWRLGKYADSLLLREAEVWLGSSYASQERLFNAAATLANDGFPARAATLIRRDLPRMDTLDLAVYLFAAGQRTAAAPLFAQLDSEGSRNPEWVRLYRAAITVQADAGEDADALPILEKAWRTPVADRPLNVRSFARGNEYVVGSYPRRYYEYLLAQVMEQTIDGGRKEAYASLVQSPALSGGLAGGLGRGKDRKRFDLLEAAKLMLASGQAEEGRNILAVELRVNPASPRANLYLAVDAFRAGQRGRAGEYLAAAKPEGDPVVDAYVEAWRARIKVDHAAMAERLLKCVELAPNDYEVRQEALQALAGVYDYGTAAQLLRVFEKEYARRDADMGPYLAIAYSTLGKYDRSLPLWRELMRRFPNSLAPLSGLGADLNRSERPAETIRTLTALTLKNKNVELTALLAEAHLALGQDRQALAWVDSGLQSAPKNTMLLRDGAGAAENLKDDVLAEYYSRRYIAVNAESAAMQGIFGQALLNQKKWEELRSHNRELLKANPLNLGALEREAERVKACEDPKKAARHGWEMDRYIIRHYWNDPSTIIRAAISAAGHGRFRHAIPTLERIMRLGPNSVTQSIIFGRISTGKALGAISVDEAKGKLRALYERHRHAATQAYAAGPNPRLDCLERIPLVVYVGRSTMEAISRFDRHLAEVGGRAVLIIGEESLSEWTEPWPNLSFLHQLIDTGRWEFFLTDNSPAALPGPTDDLADDFWLKSKWLGDRYETETEHQTRISAEMLRLRGKAATAGIPIAGWMHPSWGDYGQRAVRQTTGSLVAYRAAVRENFPLAITVVPSGYSLPWTDSQRIPVRSVGSGLDTQEFIDSVHWFHPTRRAVLELAKVKSWHGQLPAAETLFLRARQMGLDAKEIAYFHARNYQYAGDVPNAIRGAHETRRLDPERERTPGLIQDTHRLLRPLVLFEPRYTSDSDGEKYAGLTAGVGFHVRPNLELRAAAGYQRWWDDTGSFNGVSAFVGARWYFKRQNWLLAEVGGTKVTGGVGTAPEARVAWHGAYDVSKLACLNGTFDLQYTRSMVNTRKAMTKGGIFSDSFSAATSVRIDEWWETDLQADLIRRSDGNQTWDLSFRPTYRVKDAPVIRIGYWGRISDSKFDAPEYYAPRAYQSHSAVVMFRYNPKPKLTVNGLASYGISRSSGKGWGPISRANLSVSYRLNDCVQISGGFQYMKSPDYTLRQFGGSVAIRF